MESPYWYWVKPPTEVSPVVLLSVPITYHPERYTLLPITPTYADGFWEKPHVEILKKLKKGKSWIKN